MNYDGEKVDLEFLKRDGKVRYGTLHSSQLLNAKSVDRLVVEKLESLGNDSAKMLELLVSVVEKGATISVDYLLRKCPNNFDCQIPFKKNKRTALGMACQKQNLEMVRLLLEKGASPNVRDMNEQTPLHQAVRNSHVECVRLLLEDKRCDPNLVII